METLGTRLRKLREKVDKTQKEVAEDLDIPRGTYAHYELSKRLPDHSMLIKISDYYGISTDALLVGFDKILLTELLNLVVGKKKYKEFSEKANIHFDELRNICEGNIKNRPSLDTMEKIIQNNEYYFLIENNQLLEAAGYIEEAIALKRHENAISDFSNSTEDFEEALQKITLDRNPTNIKTTISCGIDNLTKEEKRKVLEYIEFLKFQRK